MQETCSTKVARSVATGAVLAVLLASAGSHAVAQQAENHFPPRTGVVQTDDGPVRGIIRDGVRQFLGIPFAAPPVGDLRWRPPRRPARWHEPLDADQFGNRCAQIATLGVFATPSFEEDCLYLNVFTPRGAAPSGGRPVMVWFYGGGLVAGESNDYNGSKLARDGNTVVVTINYRVNVFGFFAHPAIDAENHLRGNYGIMDQQFALRWVQRNIRAFGGDPGRVTIFGESAGGISVFTHMASPLSRGLFHRVISQSGMIRSLLTNPDLATAEARGREFATAMGCADQTARCLRSLSVRDILTEGVEFASQARVIVDGTILPQTLGEALSSGEFNRVPFINGVNRDELRWSVALTERATGHVLTAAEYPDAIAASFGEANVPRILARYPLSNYASPSLALAAVQTDAQFSCTVRQVSQWVSRFVERTYSYEFADRTAPSYEPPVSFPYGAAHTYELQYLFPLYHGARGTPKPLNAAQERLSDDMVSYWTTFASTGNPNSRETPFWPRYQTRRDQFQSLRLPRPVTVTNFAADHKCAFWERVLGPYQSNEPQAAATQ